MIKELFFSQTTLLAPLLILTILFDNWFSAKSHKTDIKQAIIRIIFYFSLTAIFCFGIYYYHGIVTAGLFMTGYILEYSLSIDNLFIFFLIIKVFDVKKHTNFILSYGIIITVILRLIFIKLGYEAIERFDWMLIIFGLILMYSAYKILKPKKEMDKDSVKNSVIYKVIEYFIAIDKTSDTENMFIKKNNKIFGTKLFIAMIFIVISDIVCSVDSIPAIFGITTDIFIIYSSNIFAVLGLRSAYILLLPLVDRFKYLEYGLILILFFIGFKLIISYFYYDLISVTITFTFTIFIILSSVVFSMLKK